VSLYAVITLTEKVPTQPLSLVAEENPARQPVAPLAPHVPQLATLALAWFGASSRYREALYQDRAFWHIPQTRYLCCCL